MRLLENNAIDQTYYDGAQLNNFIARNACGRVHGLKLSNTRQAIFVTAGLLIVRGYRIAFDNEEILSISVYPAATERRNLILRVTSTNEDSSVEFTTGVVSNFEDIEKAPGTYDYLIAEIEINSFGIQNVISKITDVSSGGSSQGGQTVCEMDTTQKAVTYVLADNKDMTFAAPNIASVSIVIASMYHGFNAGINIKCSQIPPQVAFTNNSDYPLKLVQFGLETPSYRPSQNLTSSMAIFCDGVSVYCYINEV